MDSQRDKINSCNNNNNINNYENYDLAIVKKGNGKKVNGQDRKLKKNVSSTRLTGTGTGTDNVFKKNLSNNATTNTAKKVKRDREVVQTSKKPAVPTLSKKINKNNSSESVGKIKVTNNKNISSSNIRKNNNESFNIAKNNIVETNGSENVLESIEKTKKLENQRIRSLERKIKKYQTLEDNNNEVSYEL